MKKTIAYIDGYNLYYGLLKGEAHIKWLDLRALVSAMFKEEHELLAVKFFTAHVRTYPHDLARCQLPEVVPLSNGRTVHRPPAWA